MPRPHHRITEIQSIAECREFQYLLMGDLRDLIDDPQDESNRQWLLSVLEVLIQLMPRERVLHQEGGGYLNQVLEEFPTWDQQVLTLQLKKLHLDYSLRELYRRIRRNKSWIAHADQVSGELRDWMELFKQLHRAENSLIMDAMLLDIGTRR